MPSGIIHRQLTLYLQILTLPSLTVLTLPEYIGLQLGILVTYYVNPDLDITTDRLGLVKYFGFETYRKLVPHRFGLRLKHWKRIGDSDSPERNNIAGSISKVMFFSHFPFIGTVMRTVLVLLPVLTLLLLFDSVSMLNLRFILMLYIGMALSDTLHIIADVFWSGFRRGL